MAAENKEKLWTRGFIMTSTVNLMLTLSMYLLLVTMAVYAMEVYGASVSKAGFVSSIFIIGTLFGRLYGGKNIARIGNRKMLLSGSAAVLITTALYFVPMGIYPLMGLRFLHGVSLGLAATATGTIVAQIIPRSRSGEGIGYFSMSVVMATAVGPLIGVVLLNQYGFTSIFIFSLVMAVVSLLLSLTVRPPEVETPAVQDYKRFSLSDYFEARAVPVSSAMFVLAFAYSGILSFVTGYASEIGLVEAGSFFFLVYGTAVLFSRPVTGPLMDKKGANVVVYPALILFAAGMLTISQADAGWMLLLAALLMGLGYGNFQSISQALAIKATPRHRLGLANTTYFIALDLGLGFGPLVLGSIVSLLGYRSMYLSLVLVILAGTAVYYFAHGRKSSALEVPETR